MKFKRCALLLILLSCLALSGCGGPEDTYKSAQALLAKGEYAKAGEQFDSIGSYEDATSLAMYCNACALCEAGNYESGIPALESLGDFKDCSYRITYYTARSYEDIAGTSDWEHMMEAQNIYKTIPVFLDSDERIAVLDERIVMAKETHYAAAVQAGENGDYLESRNAFCLLGNYGDSKNRIDYYWLREEEDAAAEATNVELLLSIATRYTAMGDYLDCVERADALNTKATEILDDKYDTAVELMQTGKYSEAIEVFAAIEPYKDSTTQISACKTFILDSKYETAMVLMNTERYWDAFIAFLDLKDYRDAKSMKQKAATEILRKANVGNYVFFGTYEQDNDSSNGDEDIEWLVLAKENDRLLVISRYALACKPYNEEATNVTWETCTLRKWLNKDFLNAVFNNKEKSMIPTVIVSADKNPSYRTTPGKDTQDKVFLLSIREYEKYFTHDIDSKCKAAAGLPSIGVYCDWWLRSPGRSQTTAVTVGINAPIIGTTNIPIESVVSKEGAYVDDWITFVRPALWINIR